MGSEVSTDANAQQAAAHMQEQLLNDNSQQDQAQTQPNTAGAEKHTQQTRQSQSQAKEKSPAAVAATTVKISGNNISGNKKKVIKSIPVSQKIETSKTSENVAMKTENIISKSDMEEYFSSDFQVKIDPSIFSINKSIIQLRRYFHEIPELSFKEIKTSEAVSKYLLSRNLEVYNNIGKKTGVVGVLRGKNSNNGPCILLRADMDALPVLETNDINFKSKNIGVMHACGHDCHMAILLSVARILTIPEYYNKLNGTVKFCFQPGEEGLAGAKYMIDDNILEYDEKNNIPKVDQVYGLHVWSYQKFGKCVVRHGPLMAGSDHFKIKITGKGGHGAEPKGTNDAVVAATQLVLQIHTIISRNLSPLEEGVITIGTFNAGERGNIIAQTAQLDGTMRWFDKKIEKRMRNRMNEIIEGISKSFNVKIEIKFGDILYPPTINHSIECVNNVENAVKSVFPEGVIRSEPTMAAEDFSFFLNKRPGCYFFLGCGVNDGTNNIYPHHKPDFKVDEKCLVAGVQIMVNLILDLLKPQPKQLQTTNETQQDTTAKN